MKSGGAPAFLQTLSSDIIPYVESHYKTNSNRGLFGHSLGGMFAAYCLLTAPDLFQEYSINSPSLWWDNGKLMAMEKAFVTDRRDLTVRIFMSVGALEGPPMVSPLTDFAEVLQAHYPNTLITKQVFENETHVSVVASASSRTLKVLYGR
jgi:predicted alpha/beta superfamily hydrolase